MRLFSNPGSLMGHTKVKTFVGIISLLVWALLLIDPARFFGISKILLLYFSIPIFFIWLTLGLAFGLISTIITCVVLLLLFERTVYIFPVGSLIITSFVAQKLKRIFERNTKDLVIDNEKTEEELNLLANEVKSEENDNSRMRSTLERITHLKGIVDGYSQSVLEDEISNSIVSDSLELFKDANRALLYLVDTEKQELKLVKSKKQGTSSPIKAKRGDMFDRWVLKHRIPLLVEDISKDFRFSLEEKEIDEGFSSLINAPLISENKIFGILRLDSNEKAKFTQSDLRFLDIIADLSSISLQNAALYKKVEDLAIHDSLTGLYVHKYFIERLNSEIKRSLRNDIDISLLMLDIDNFKTYNDKYGHNAGDLALRHMSSILRSFADPGDIISRYGGEEFMLLLLGKNKSAATKIAEKIRQKISKTPLILRREKTNITVSIGVASCPSETKLTEELLMLVDSRLYKAKENGRNRIWAK